MGLPFAIEIIMFNVYMCVCVCMHACVLGYKATDYCYRIKVARSSLENNGQELLFTLISLKIMLQVNIGQTKLVYEPWKLYYFMGG